MTDDAAIVALYWARSEKAISETAEKYGRYCRTIAYNILSDAEDAEESVNDAYLAAWNSIPPQRPSLLSAYLGKITRRISIDKWRKRGAAKRGGGAIEAALEELSECIPSGNDPARTVETMMLTEILDRFLASLPREARTVFLQRYWYMMPVKEIAAELNASESKVKMLLMRSRGKLRETLEKEGVEV